MTEMHYHKDYPFGISPTIDPDTFSSVVSIFDDFVNKYHDKPAFSCMGRTISFGELEQQSANFAAWLQNETDLQRGDRIAVQLPNILQFPVVVWGALRAGLVVVNTNPLYTDREMEHQFNDSGKSVV